MKKEKREREKEKRKEEKYKNNNERIRIKSLINSIVNSINVLIREIFKYKYAVCICTIYLRER